MQVTITLLPVSLSLVHIPRSRLTRLSHPVLRQILQPNPAFLNITCNEIELSIFAEHHMLHDFEILSRRDRHRKKLSRLDSISGRKPSPSVPVPEHVEISYEKWNVLQIDSHNDHIGKSGTRVHDLSAPLADAGISILYQSSYMSDFIFVKEARIQEAMALFETAGFHLYSNSPVPSHFSSTIADDYHSSECTFSKPTHRGAVLISSIDIPPTLSCNSLKPISALDNAPPTAQRSPRNKSHSPTSGEVRMLIPDLACVGLSDELGVDHWGLKIVKLVAFPDLIPSYHKSIPHLMKQASLDTHLTNSHIPQSSHSDFTSASISYNSGDDSDSVSSSSEDDGYFSYSPENASVASLGSNTSRSYSDLPSAHSPKSTRSPSNHHFCGGIAPLSPILPKLRSPLPNSVPPLTEVYKPSCSAVAKVDSRVPFFSFTRTPEGSSLTADVHLLATLFPPHERHMVISSGELEAAESQLEGGNSESSDESDELDELFSGSDPLKCLQIDLRRFGLDKHGLVTRFSRVLEENDINHMYSSTFKTANILVDKKDAIRAQSLLRSC